MGGQLNGTGRTGGSLECLVQREILRPLRSIARGLVICRGLGGTDEPSDTLSPTGSPHIFLLCGNCARGCVISCSVVTRLLWVLLSRDLFREGLAHACLVMVISSAYTGPLPRYL